MVRREPLYYRVKMDIEKKIKDGTYKSGDFIPSEPELEKMYRVSRTTIRTAINMLVDEGYLTIVRGMGTKVSPSQLNVTTVELMSFTELMRIQGMVPSAHDIKITKMIPDEDILRKLNLQEPEEVYEIYRLRAADGEPITTNTSYIPCSMVEERDLLYLGQEQSLYRVLEKNANIIIQATEDTISATKAPPQIGALLKVDKHDPVLKIERIAYDPSDTIIEYSVIYIRADRYKHTITLRRR